MKIKKLSLGALATLPYGSAGTQNYGDKSVLEEVVLSQNLGTMPDSSFREYSKLKEINLENITSFGSSWSDTGAFRNCTSLISVDVQNSSNVSAGTFSGCSSLESANIRNATTIESNAFSYCRVLKSVTFSPQLHSIAADAFFNCSELSMDLNFPNLESLGDRAFMNTKITSFVAPNIVSINGVYMDTGAFRDCTLMHTVDLGDKIESIGQADFYGCISLASFICRAITPPTLANANALNGTNNCPIYVPDASVEAYKTATNWSQYQARIKPLSEYVEE